MVSSSLSFALIYLFNFVSETPVLLFPFLFDAAEVLLAAQSLILPSVHCHFAY